MTDDERCELHFWFAGVGPGLWPSDPPRKVYDVTYKGRVIVSMTGRPVLDGCRELCRLGLPEETDVRVFYGSNPAGGGEIGRLAGFKR